MPKELSFDAKLALARKGAALDVDDEDSFYALARGANVSVSQLAYWTNAYEAAGESGFRALQVKGKIPELPLKGALKAIEGFLQTRSQDCGGFEVAVRGNTITVKEKTKTLIDKRDIAIDAFQVRYTVEDNRWHLFWKRASGKWWPYIGENDIRTIADCLNNVREDAWGCFWV